VKYTFEPFSVKYEPVLSPLDDFEAECVLAVNRILRNQQRPIVLLMSGGLDSELMANVLLKARVPFRCLIVRLLTEVPGSAIVFNQHDFDFALRWCAKNNVEYMFHDIDLFEQGSLLCEHVISARGFSPQFACQMEAMKWCAKQGYFFIAGHSEMDFVLRDGQYFLQDEQREATLDNFCELHHLSGSLHPLKDSRVIASFIQLPTVQRLLHAGVPRLLDYKHACYSDVFEMEPRNKATGFEKVQEWDYHLRTYLKRRYGHLDAKFYTPLTLFIAQDTVHPAL
jgi:hypothetical protein